ncbi:MAG: DUF2723 domain-containing protein [Muribaculaceae bacterium]|nr:DUF2723 domain-containing protein [Muribaculaceae bacterium]
MPAPFLRRYRLPLEISSWITFAAALTLYWITLDPSVSYWDCPEYVTVASRMEVGHPPGNPIWMLAMRVATSPFPSQHHAYIINLCSAFLMAFSAFFLCRLIFVPFRYLFSRRQEKFSISPGYLDLIISLVSAGGALCFAFCDSAWFSAVEAEVYAMSAFLSSLSLWIMIRWALEENPGRQNHLLILLAYITGLSLGVHQLNLLLIPVFAVIWIYKRFPEKISPALVIGSLICSFILIGILLFGLMPGSLFWAQTFEIFFVNNLQFPYDGGVLIYAGALLFSGLFSIFLINYRIRILPYLFIFIFIWLSGIVVFDNNIWFGAVISLLITIFLHFRSYYYRKNCREAIWMLLFILLGFSSFGVILIRAKAAPSMNQGAPDNIFSLASYISREQYPSTPLLFGATPYSHPLFEEDFINHKPVYHKYLLEKGKPVYIPYSDQPSLNYRSRMFTSKDSLKNNEVMSRKHGYLLADYEFSQKLTPELDMWFPRITSRKLPDREAYADWAGMTEETMDRVSVSETIDSTGRFKTRISPIGGRPVVYSYRPTYMQNLRYFIEYQTFYMYLRYLCWNFIGRQNDFASTGEIEHGNFISGIPAIDKFMVGDTSSYPLEIYKDNKGRNIYFGIPFILAVVGIAFLFGNSRLSRRYLTVITVFFIMTGIAIVVYLNQTPGEPRERDYTFLGSYMAFAIWIAAGSLFISLRVFRILSRRLSLLLAFIISIGPPALMAVENFDDHDRRGRYQPEFFASSLIDLEIPSIIFTQGDNLTFPNWYASEVMDPGSAHTPADVTYLSLPSYIINLKKQGNKGIETIAPSNKLAYGAFILTRIPPDSVSFVMPLEKALSLLYESNPAEPVWPTSLVKIPVAPGDSTVINLHKFTSGGSWLPFRQLMMLDFLASQLNSPSPKALYFPSAIDHRFYHPLDPFLRPALFGKIYAPWLSEPQTDSLMAVSLLRELNKLNPTLPDTRYLDPLITDRSGRYRGELVMAAQQRLNSGDTLLPSLLIEKIENHLPYTQILPRDFTVEDSTLYEGREFVNLLNTLADSTHNIKYKHKANAIDSLMKERKKEWLRFYNSLTPAQRHTLSNRSKRLLR